jgi:hypothetical protein
VEATDQPTGDQPNIDQPSTDPPSIPSLPVRFGQVFFSPGQLFEALREKPAWVGALLVSALLIGGSTLLIPVDMLIDAAREQIISQGGEVPPGFENMGAIFRVTGTLFPVIAVFIMAFIWAAVCTFVFNFIFGGEAKYTQYLSVVSHGMIIGAVGALALVPLKIAQGDPQLLLSIGTFAVFLEEGYLLNVLKMLDLFGLWGSTVMGIGVTKIAPRVSLVAALSFFYGLSVVIALIFASFM